jgi:UDP-glucose 4-epimerase
MRIIHGEERLGDVRRNYSDTSKAKRMLGWQPQRQLAEGLLETAKWFAGKAA